MKWQLYRNATTVLTVYEADCCEEMQYILFDYFIGSGSVQFDSVWQQRKSTADCIECDIVSVVVAGICDVAVPQHQP